MRLAATATVSCILVGIGLAQSKQPTTLEPTPLEVFAGRPTAHVTWTSVVGRLESPEARATITALIVEDKTSEPRLMSGVRIDLAHTGATPSCDWKYRAWRIMCERANAAVYVEEQRLEAVRDGINRGAAQLRPWEFISKYETKGRGWASTGLIVCGYQFSERQPSELAALFTVAITELKAAPR